MKAVLTAILLILAAPVHLAGADTNVVTALHYQQNIRPLLETYCLACHSTEKHKGDLDLERFSSFEQVLKDGNVWQRVAEQLGEGEMPPKEKPQPTTAERGRLLGWVTNLLHTIALANAGDPGPVVLRRLSNAEYTYTVRDLTGVESLDPAHEFPIDGAAGEGFMNAGNALVMSPSLLTKYLDAGKLIASHAVLLPDGIRFSSHTTRRDWTEETLKEIRYFYRQFTDPGGGDKVNLQGIVFETNEGGRLPLEKYLAATLELRARPSDTGLQAIAAQRGLSARYLRIVWSTLTNSQPSLLMDGIRARWQTATPNDVAGLAGDIAQWQKALWKFGSVGHIGKLGGPKAWMEPVSPLTAKQEVRIKIQPASDAKEVVLYLVARDAGDGNENDFVVWHQPRLVAAGRHDLMLRDLRAVVGELTQRREQVFASAARALAAATEVSELSDAFKINELARKHAVDGEILRAWINYLGIGTSGETKIEGHFTNTLDKLAGYDFIKGWGASDTPNLVANSSDQAVRIPGNMKAHSIAVHPSPKLQVGVGWRSPLAGAVRVEGAVTHAHPECGNGVTWALELRRGSTRRRLAAGNAQGSKEVKVGPLDNQVVRADDVIVLLIGPRDGNHACDLTAVDLRVEQDTRRWDLAKDVSPNVLAGNPHADGYGNEGVWHFFTEPVSGGGPLAPVIPPGSLLAKWQSASHVDEKQRLAQEVEQLLKSGPTGNNDDPDTQFYNQVALFGGPFLASIPVKQLAADADVRGPVWGVDPAQFGRHPSDRAITTDPASLCVRAPSMIEVRIPADLAAGAEFVATAMLEQETGAEGSVQVQALTTKPEDGQRLLPSAATVVKADGPWTSDNRTVSHATPILANENSEARKRVESALEEFRGVFPAALCYTKIVPVDEVVTLTLYHREDHHLARLMLDEPQQAKLDRLWNELNYVSHHALMLVDVFEQLWQYATQDADPKVFEPLRKPIQERAAAFRRLLVETEPKHVEGVLEFADRAYRRPLTAEEKEELHSLYAKLRKEELSHDEAIRLTLARVFVAPAFLYRFESPPSGTEPGAVSDWELATRLSYFLWSSLPDKELRMLATAGKLRDPNTLASQVRRMLGDPRVRRLAIEFACQWLHIHSFETLDEKSERHFPMFGELRDDMYEEPIRFFTDLFQRDGSIIDILNANYIFVNEPLAKHYGIPGVSGQDWQRVDGVRKFSRGGILGMGATLAKQSGASRTSPILRGNWVAEALLGDKLPRPPKDVPTLPDDEAALEGLTVRQLVEKHSSDPNCSKCHVRIDPFGYALERFDAIGRRREKDLGARPIDTRAKALDGSEFDGIDGLRDYLLTKRRDAFVKQFCRKLLGYALGRGVQLSDEPLLADMQRQLEQNRHRFAVTVETIVRSRQFREIRGRDVACENVTTASE